MTTTTAGRALPTPTPTPTTGDVIEDHEGWQALAAASLGRLLTGTELAAAEHLPTELALDLLFPGLPDPARHEALSTLG